MREALDALPAKLNVFRMLAHAETCFRPFLRLGQAILTAQELDPVLRELTILRVAKLTPAEYEWVQHAAIAKAVGATDEQIEAIDRSDTASDAFDADQSLVLRFTDEVVKSARPSDATFDALAARFSAREIVELTIAIGYYMAIARVMEVADIDIDPPAGMAVAGRSSQ